MEQAARAVLGAAPRRARASSCGASRTSAIPGRPSTWRCRSPRATASSRARELDATVERFHALHEELHTYASRDEEPILRSVRLTAVGVTDKPRIPTHRPLVVAAAA